MTPAFQSQQPLQRVELGALVAGLILATLLMWPLRAHVTDDAFVHLQYARHLAQGRGLVFNLGEHVYACTSPLWAAVLADAMALGWNGLIVARLIGFLATLATIPLFLQLMRRSLRLPALRAFATLAWSVHAWMLQWATSGMETPVAVALVLAGFVALTEGQHWGERPVRTGSLWALAALTRPEAVFLIVLWGMLLLIDTNNRSQLRRMLFGLVPPLLIYGTWLMFARFFFGTFWPRTLAARAVEPSGFSLGGLVGQLRVIAETDGLLLLLLAVSFVLGGRALWAKRPPSAQSWLPWLWIAGLPLLYVSRGIEPSSRYLVLIAPVLAWLAWRAADRWWLGNEPQSLPRRTQATVLGFAVMALLVVTNLGVYRRVVLPGVTRSTTALKDGLVRWGDWFGRHTASDVSIASHEVGALGYRSRRRVYDLGGIVSPELERHVRGVPDATARFAFAHGARPTFLVDRSARAFDLIERSAYGGALIPLGRATAAVDGARADSVYSFYRIEWSAYDTLRARGPDHAEVTPATP